MSIATWESNINKYNDTQGKIQQLNGVLSSIPVDVDNLINIINDIYRVNNNNPIISSQIEYIKNKVMEISNYLGNNVTSSITSSISHTQGLIEQQRAAEAAAAAHAAAQAAAAQAAASANNRRGRR